MTDQQQTGGWPELLDGHHRSRQPATGELPTHRPFAAVLSCSDARVPPSVLFDQPAGSLFVIRIAGNTASPAALASLDYAVEQLGVDLVVVLGHTGCGAVQAASAGKCGGHLLPIVEPICRLAKANPSIQVEALVRLNVEETVRVLTEHPGPTGEAARSGAITIQGSVHDLRTGDLVTLPGSDIHSRPNLPPI
jgi:carbonic anhydrase